MGDDDSYLRETALSPPGTEVSMGATLTIGMKRTMGIVSHKFPLLTVFCQNATSTKHCVTLTSIKAMHVEAEGL